MDDMTSRLSEILNDPASMEKLKNLAAMFGGSSQQEETRPPPPPQQQRPQQYRSRAAAPARTRTSAAPSIDPELMRSMMKLAPALSRMRQEDSSTQLLRALRPFLGESRRKKLDEALRLMQLARMLPYLRNSGAVSVFLVAMEHQAEQFRKRGKRMAENTVPQGAEMNQLRQEAIRRAREMQARAQIPVTTVRLRAGPAAGAGAGAASAQPQQMPRTPAAEQMPIHPRQENSAQDRRPERRSALPVSRSAARSIFSQKTPNGRMILLLLLILMEEKADNSLLFAMMYLLS